MCLSVDLLPRALKQSWKSITFGSMHHATIATDGATRKMKVKIEKGRDGG